MTHPVRHGIVNGCHTYLTIREAIETATDDEEPALRQALVRLDIHQGVSESVIPAMADGLNRSKQVDDPTLRNLAGLSEDIK